MPNEKLNQAIAQCRNYRRYLREKQIPQHLATKGFLLTKEMIERLLAQNGGAIDGIRIYVGLDETTPEKAIKPYAVPCVKNGEKYNDWKVPHTKPTEAVDGPVAATTTMGDASTTTLTATSLTTDPVLEEPRPCPSECGDTNDLNTGA